MKYYVTGNNWHMSAPVVNSITIHRTAYNHVFFVEIITLSLTYMHASCGYGRLRPSCNFILLAQVSEELAPKRFVFFLFLSQTVMASTHSDMYCRLHSMEEAIGERLPQVAFNFSWLLVLLRPKFSFQEGG